MSSSHDCTYLRVGWGGVTTSPCTCSHLRCYALHVFFTCFHIASGGVGGWRIEVYQVKHAAGVCQRSEKTKWLQDHSWHANFGQMLGLLERFHSKQCPKECEEQTSACWDLEPCLPMALAIQSSPCLAANGSQGSQRTSNEMLHLQVAKVKRAECARSGGIPCSHLLIVIGDMPTFATQIMPFKWNPHDCWNTSHANSSGMFRRYHRTAMKLTRHSPAVICGVCLQLFFVAPPLLLINSESKERHRLAMRYTFWIYRCWSLTGNAQKMLVAPLVIYLHFCSVKHNFHGMSVVTPIYNLIFDFFYSQYAIWPLILRVSVFHFHRVTGYTRLRYFTTENHVLKVPRFS